jgi:hypothetical protein
MHLSNRRFCGVLNANYRFDLFMMGKKDKHIVIKSLKVLFWSNLSCYWFFPVVAELRTGVGRTAFVVRLKQAGRSSGLRSPVRMNGESPHTVRCRAGKYFRKRSVYL